MSTTFADRWDAPVQAADGAAVLLLDQAVEDLVALSGDPAGGAEAAIAADGELALARVYRAYLSLYATTAEGAAEGDLATAVDLLIDIRPEAHVVGGGHAQRDVIDLTLIAAAARSGQAGLARALVTERTARKPAAAPSARALVIANGGDETWLVW